MERKYKITIPEPCREDWNKMTPNKNGRFCDSCSKSVVDFTNMLPDEIQHYFVSNQNKSICGRFKKTQLNEIIIQIPSHIVYSQTQYHRIFLLALFICMGTTLFSCKQENNVKQKIDKIEVVKDTTKTEMIYVGDVPVNENDTMRIPPPPPPPKLDQIKFTKQPNHKKSKHCKPKNDTLIKMTTMGMIVPEVIIDSSKIK